MSAEATKSLKDISSANDYDPNSMPVRKAREYIRAFLAPVTAVERLHIRAALGRVLAEDIRSTHERPGARQLGDGRLRGAFRRSQARRTRRR